MKKGRQTERTAIERIRSQQLRKLLEAQTRRETVERKERFATPAPEPTPAATTHRASDSSC